MDQGSDRLADRIEASDGKAAYARTDVKRREDLSNLVGLAIERYGKLDVLVNNAGVAPISLLDELGETLKNSPSAFARALLIARLPLTTFETRPRDPKIDTRSDTGFERNHQLGDHSFASGPAVLTRD